MFNKILFKFPERVSLKTLVLRTTCFGSSYPQVVRVPPVKNHCSKLSRSYQLKSGSGEFLLLPDSIDMRLTHMGTSSAPAPFWPLSSPS